MYYQKTVVFNQRLLLTKLPVIHVPSKFQSKNFVKLKAIADQIDFRYGKHIFDNYFFNCSQGEVGDTGPRGSKGKAGDDGVAGEKGETVTGQTGLPGDKGGAGVIGLFGDAGSKGRKGERGSEPNTGKTNCLEIIVSFLKIALIISLFCVRKNVFVIQY